MNLSRKMFPPYLLFKPASECSVPKGLIIGKKVHRLTIQEFLGRTRSGSPLVRVLCDCGSMTWIRFSALYNKEPTKSCGCFIREVMSGKASHGMSKHPSYSAYSTMKSRCFYEGNHNFKNYGLRGIEICERWLGRMGFKNFMEDMGEKPSALHSVERRDNNLGYSPDNCYWGTKLEQSLNRRSVRRVTIDGVTKPFCVWAKENGIGNSVAHNRLKSGWDIISAVTVPAGETKKAELNHLSKFTNDQVREIRKAFDAGEKVMSIARRYDARYQSIYKIVRRESYQSVA